MLTTLTASLVMAQGTNFSVAWNKSASGYWNLSSDGLNVYALSTAGQLRVYSGRDGSILYDKKFGNEASAITVLPDGTCYVVADAKVSKLDRNLNKEWTSTQTVQYPKIGTGIAVSKNGTIAVNTLRGLQIFGKDGSSNGQTYLYGMAVRSGDPVFVKDDTVAFMGGGLAYMNTTDLKPIWSSKTGAGEGPVLAGAALYVSSNETIAKACVLRISIVDGKPVWNTPTTTINRAPAVSRDSVTVPGDLGMWGLAPSDGKVGWRNSLHTFSRALVVGKNLAAVMSKHVGGSQIHMSLVDMLTGKVLASEQVLTGAITSFEPPFVLVGEHAVAGSYMDHIFLARLT